MKLEHLLLGLLGELPRTGYEIKKFLDTHGRFLRSNTTMSQVYRSLSSMTDRGWVAYAIDERPGAQNAKIYRVTPEGMTVFRDWLEGPYSPPSRFQDPEFAARLGFAGYLTAEKLIALVETELDARREQVAKYRFRDRSIADGTTIEFDRALAAAVGERLHLNGTQQIDLHIAQLEELRRELLDGTLPTPSTPSTTTR
ncbi:PadR family transcriptional regulator [Microbacterium sp. Leaf159]|uniref:PadR family transcriptional regulator n=1 Tax=Microbacterium sp. Leaf159 TaxID=1736279 RepID=UPI0006FFFB64|nr:PadR family transcriptional regulator [Microbacterium sp. Leaf159]KQR39961.1 PadR family transcriptional regulator [Microbacterium sp. Leaf159]